MKCERCNGELKNKDAKYHEDIYDCCDVVNPNWMKEWLERMDKNKEPYVSDFVKWSKSVVVCFALLFCGCEWIDEQLTVQDLYNGDDYEIELEKNLVKEIYGNE